jgi:hypothetical protein
MKGSGLVGIATATGWKARVRFPAAQDLFLLRSVKTDTGAHPASYPIRTGDKADHSPPSSA